MVCMVTEGVVRLKRSIRGRFHPRIDRKAAELFSLHSRSPVRRRSRRGRAA
jgi:hypothetical protein